MPMLALSMRSDEPAFSVIDRSAAESEARRLLETFGVVDLECLDDHGVAPGTHATHLIAVDGDVHDYCNFSAYILPQLKARGWHIEEPKSYPYRALAGDTEWYVHTQEEEGRPDWFSLELGVEVDGQRVDLLPTLLRLLRDDSRNLRSLARSTRRNVAIALEDGGWMSVPPPRLRMLIRVLFELYGSGQGPASRVSALQCCAVDRWVETMGELGAAVKRTGARSVSVIAEPPKRVEAPPGFQAVLRPYQEVGLSWLQYLRTQETGGVLADDMGLGKTIQVIAHLAREHEEQRRVGPSLVVAPTSMVGTWVREIRKFAPNLRVTTLHGPKRHACWEESFDAVDVLITSYPILTRDEDRFAELSLHLLVLDEAHTIKNARSLVHQAAKRLRAEQRICLSGTPVENHLGELWALFNFVEPGLLGDELSFRRNFRIPIEQEGDDDRLATLRDRISPFLLRRVKEEVATELPGKTELMRPVSLSGRQRELYESIRVAAHARVRRVVNEKGIAASTVSILDALMKLRQVCCDPKLLRMAAAKSVIRSAKTDTFFDLVEGQLRQGRRILVFSQFTKMLAILGKGLSQRGVRFLSLTGASTHRQRLIDRFEHGDADVFLISLKAGGVGLTLTSADTVIHYDPWWNPAAEAQATDRAYRIGQTKPVFVHRLFVAGSVEERILGLQRRKQRLADGILAANGAKRASFTEEDLGHLFAPLVG